MDSKYLIESVLMLVTQSLSLPLLGLYRMALFVLLVSIAMNRFVFLSGHRHDLMERVFEKLVLGHVLRKRRQILVFILNVYVSLFAVRILLVFVDISQIKLHVLFLLDFQL